MSETPRLPEAFAALEVFIEPWAVSGLAARAALRSTTTEAQRRAFHAAMKLQIAPVLDYLDTRPIDAMAPADAALLNMALAFTHVALAIEVQAEAEPVHTGMRNLMRIVGAPPEPWN